MKKLFVVAILASALAACGSKKPATATPGGGTDVKSDGAATGGATYGGATYGGGAVPAPATP